MNFGKIKNMELESQIILLSNNRSQNETVQQNLITSRIICEKYKYIKKQIIEY